MRAPEEIKNIIEKSGAIKDGIKEGYPAHFHCRIPLVVRMRRTVTSDAPPFIAKTYKPCIMGREYFVTVNSYGAVTAIHDDCSFLGLKPDEFDVIEWHEHQHPIISFTQS